MTSPEIYAEELLLELPELVEQCVNGTADEEQIAKLNRLMIEDRQARMLYTRYIYTLCGLKTWSEYPLASLEGNGLGPEGFTADIISDEDQWQTVPRPQGLLGGIYRGTVGFFSGELSLSILAATVIMASALWLAWVFNISHYQQVAKKAPVSPAERVCPEDLCLGRITGMKDCVWAKGNTGAIIGAAVTVDRRYVMSSGLLEITYATGAKLILKGPCDYKVDSAAGGFLRQGKLTANIRGQRLEGRGQKSETSSLIPHPSSLFSIKTPTAIITDLGTEFGVEVKENGDAETHVLEGKVEVKVLGDDRRKVRVVQLVAGESALVSKVQGEQVATVTRGKADVAKFPIRPGNLADYASQQKRKSLRRWQVFKKELLNRKDLSSYYDFQPDKKDRSILRNLLPSNYDSRLVNASWVQGRFPGKYALHFDWINSRVDLPTTMVDSRRMTMMIWARIDSLPEERAGLFMSNGWWVMGQVHWQILHDGKMSIGVVTDHHKDVTVVSSRPAVDAKRLGQWSLLAVTCDLDAEQIVLYRNGDAVGRGAIDAPNLNRFIGYTASIANWYNPNSSLTEKDLSLRGCVDEFMIFKAALSAEEIRDIYEASAFLSGDEGNDTSGAKTKREGL